MTKEQLPQAGHILSHVLAFTHLLREMGVDVSPGQALELVRALEYAPITSREDFRGAARCTLIRRHEDLPLFDTAFAFYWRSGGVDPLSMLVPQLKVPAKPLRLRQRPPAQDGVNDADDEAETDDELGSLGAALMEALRGRGRFAEGENGENNEEEQT